MEMFAVMGEQILMVLVNKLLKLVVYAYLNEAKRKTWNII
jgi:hypothetical protein